MEGRAFDLAMNSAFPMTDEVNDYAEVSIAEALKTTYTEIDTVQKIISEASPQSAKKLANIQKAFEKFQTLFCELNREQMEEYYHLTGREEFVDGSAEVCLAESYCDLLSDIAGYSTCSQILRDKGTAKED